MGNNNVRKCTNRNCYLITLYANVMYANELDPMKTTRKVKECQSMTSYFTGDHDQDKVTNAEVLFTGYIVEHNLPFEASSHSGDPRIVRLH